VKIYNLQGLQKNWITNDLDISYYWPSKPRCVLITTFKINENASTFHVSILEPFHEFKILEKHIQPPPVIKMGSEEEFQVEKILDLQVFHDFLEYLIY